MAENKWRPPKGISIIYKGKGFRKRAKREQDQKSEGKEKQDEAEDEG